MTNPEIIDEFIEQTPQWVDRMIRMDMLQECPACSLIPDKMLELVEAIKELKEKADKYDQLSK